MHIDVGAPDDFIWISLPPFFIFICTFWVSSEAIPCNWPKKDPEFDRLWIRRYFYEKRLNNKFKKLYFFSGLASSIISMIMYYLFGGNAYLFTLVSMMTFAFIILHIYTVVQKSKELADEKWPKGSG
jgi:hypothetical protein